MKNLTKTTGKHLVRAYKTWQVEMLLPKDVRHHFLHGEDSPKNLRGKPRSKFKQSLGTDELALAEFKKKPILDGWKRLIEEARLKNAGHIIDQSDLVAKYAAKFKSTADKSVAVAEMTHDLQWEPLDNNQQYGSPAERQAVEIVAESTGQLTPILSHLDAWLDYMEYTPTVTLGGRNFMKNTLVKQFKYFEEISLERIQTYAQNRLSGADGEKKWVTRTLVKNLSYLKQYWSYCNTHQNLAAPNLIDHKNILPKVPGTKAHKKKNRKKEANHSYTVEDCWKIHSAAKNKKGSQNEILADLILLGMYTGCRINELCSLKLTEVKQDRIIVDDAKTDAGEREIPIHPDIQQDVERLVQTSTDGYLLSGLVCNNQFDDRSKAIGQRFGRLKTKLGFQLKLHSFHSFRATLATQLLNAGVPLEFAARIIGHSNPENSKNTMTFVHYAGELTWKNKVEAMAKVKYK